ncbi:MAG: hypothetical protein QXT22_01480 [Candidatus Hadarchaeales archaeon]
MGEEELAVEMSGKTEYMSIEKISHRDYPKNKHFRKFQTAHATGWWFSHRLMPSAVVVEKRECITRPLHAFSPAGWKEAVKCSDPVLESFKETLDVASDPARDDHGLQPKPLCRPPVPRTAIADEHRLSIAVHQTPLNVCQKPASLLEARPSM